MNRCGGHSNSVITLCTALYQGQAPVENSIQLTNDNDELEMIQMTHFGAHSGYVGKPVDRTCSASYAHGGDCIDFLACITYNPLNNPQVMLAVSSLLSTTSTPEWPNPES